MAKGAPARTLSGPWLRICQNLEGWETGRTTQQLEIACRNPSDRTFVMRNLEAMEAVGLVSADFTGEERKWILTTKAMTQMP